MNLGTDVFAALPGFRAQAESRFTETFKVFYVTKVMDDATGLYIDNEVTVHDNVHGRIKFPTLTVSEHAQAGRVPATQDVHIHVAVSATPNVAVDHLWRVTASTADPSLVNRVFRTKGSPQAGQVSAHRYPVESNG